jgi:hypothetical protein
MMGQTRVTYGKADVQFHEYSNLLSNSFISAVNWLENKKKANSEVSSRIQVKHNANTICLFQTFAVTYMQRNYTDLNPLAPEFFF